MTGTCVLGQGKFLCWVVPPGQVQLPQLLPDPSIAESAVIAGTVQCWGLLSSAHSLSMWDQCLWEYMEDFRAPVSQICEDFHTFYWTLILIDLGWGILGKWKAFSSVDTRKKTYENMTMSWGLTEGITGVSLLSKTMHPTTDQILLHFQKSLYPWFVTSLENLKQKHSNTEPVPQI
jgi:hypothetical protein